MGSAIVEVGTSNYTQLPRWYIKGTEGTATITDWDLNGEMVQATGREDVAAPKPVQAGVGLTKTMAPHRNWQPKKFLSRKPKRILNLSTRILQRCTQRCRTYR